MCVSAGTQAEGMGESKEGRVCDEQPGILERARRAFKCQLFRFVAE